MNVERDGENVRIEAYDTYTPDQVRDVIAELEGMLPYTYALQDTTTDYVHAKRYQTAREAYEAAEDIHLRVYPPRVKVVEV